VLHILCLKPKFRRGWFRYSSNLVFKFLPRYYDLLNHQSVHATGEEHKPSPITLEIFYKISYTAANKGGIMPLRLPDSPVKSISRCFKCNNLSIEFWNPKHNRSYTVEEWLTICEDGKESLRKILRPIVEDPKWFFD